MPDNRFTLPLGKLYPEIASLEEMEEKVTAEIARRKERRRLIRADLKAYREAAALLERRGAVQAEYTPAEGEDAKPVQPPFGDLEPAGVDVEGDAPFRHRKELARGAEVFIDYEGSTLHGRHGRVQHDAGDVIHILLDEHEGVHPFTVHFHPDHVKVVVPGWRPQVGDRVRVTQEGDWFGHYGRVTGLPRPDEPELWRVRLDDMEEHHRHMFSIGSLALVEHANAVSAVMATSSLNSLTTE